MDNEIKNENEATEKGEEEEITKEQAIQVARILWHSCGWPHKDIKALAIEVSVTDIYAEWEQEEVTYTEPTWLADKKAWGVPVSWLTGMTNPEAQDEA